MGKISRGSREKAKGWGWRIEGSTLNNRDIWNCWTWQRQHENFRQALQSSRVQCSHHSHFSGWHFEWMNECHPHLSTLNTHHSHSHLTHIILYKTENPEAHPCPVEELKGYRFKQVRERLSMRYSAINEIS